MVSFAALWRTKRTHGTRRDLRLRHLPIQSPWRRPRGRVRFLDWFKKPYPGQGIFEFYRMRAERRQNPENPERYRVRLQAPSGMGSVQTFSGRHINVSPDGTIEMSADDAQYLIRAGWTKLAEWTRDEAA